MKTFSILLFIVGALFLAVQLYTVFSIIRIEKQPYRVVESKSGYEIRYYPSVKVAKINSPADTYKGISRTGFQKLASYIFGGNEENQKIAMTSPVEMEINDTASSMKFVMPKIYATKTLPNPNNNDIILENSEEEYVAALRFRGLVNDQILEKKKGELSKMLKQQKLQTRGSFRYLGYNPPYQLFGRRNEVIVRIDFKEKKM